ncbi:hypothetical protein HanRHA438_Chr02g0066611 [Helianthus annuus]|nr:hypothetical protein HanRHA438_Chr02g0066611 [Helianthus annuus]
MDIPPSEHLFCFFFPGPSEPLVDYVFKLRFHAYNISHIEYPQKHDGLLESRPEMT